MMKIESLQQLKETIQACRKLGVERIKLGDVEFHLGPAPMKQRRYPKELPKTAVNTNTTYIPGGVNENVQILSDAVDTPDSWDSMTEEQKLLYSTAEPQ